METSDERKAVLETGNIKKQQFSIQKFNCLLVETHCFTAGRHSSTGGIAKFLQICCFKIKLFVGQCSKCSAG